MALDYTWKITGLRKVDSGSLDSIIVGTSWTVTGTDEDGIEGVFTGATPFEPHSVDPTNFTTFDSLTQDQVLGWIKSYVSGSDHSTNYWGHITERIVKEIQSVKRPVSTLANGEFPWASVSGSGS
jgi:hypothetical protein